jgi:sulfate adenylyltransferase
VSLLVEDAQEREELSRHAATLVSLQLSARSLCDLELLATGAFSPLDRFMPEPDYRRVLSDMRLASGLLFPIPVTLTAPSSLRGSVGKEIALRSAKNDLLAILRVEEAFDWDRVGEARAVCSTIDPRHPLVAEMNSWGPLCLSGPLRVLRLPRHDSFTPLRRTPSETRRLLADLGRPRVVAFQTRNPIHRAHEELTKRAVAQVDGTLLLHPVVGLTKPGDIDFYTRVRCYRALVEHHYDPERTLLSLLPLAMRMAGPREAVWHAIIRRNFGVSDFIVGRDHAGPGVDSNGRPFYGPYDAQELALKHAAEIGVGILSFEEMVYLPDENRYEERSRAGERRVWSLSGTQVRDEYLAAARPLPAWFTRPEVAAILAEVSVPKCRQGFCVWFTGLSGAGKTTIAEVLSDRLLEHGRQVTVLDGDVVRTHLSRGLGFSKEDRDTNILRIGFVASEIVRHNGAVICAAVSPYRDARNQVRNMVGPDRLLTVYVNTPLEVCEQRDAKGLYAAARQGRARGVTGIDDPYEPPVSPDLALDGSVGTPQELADRIVEALRTRGFLSAG